MIDQNGQQRTMQPPGAGIIPAGRPTVDYKEYPKMMTHPQFQPGKPSDPIKHPSGFTYHGIGTPVRFPHVLVKTPDDEEYHKSLGYVSQGKCDPAAFDRAVGAGQIPEQVAYKPLEYPKWVQGKLCNTQDEEDRWLAQISGAPTEALVGLSEPVQGQQLVQTETREERVARLRRELDELEGPTREDITEGYKIAKKVLLGKKKRTMTAQQKRDHSAAVKAGLARKRALTESNPAEQGGVAPDQ